MKAPPMNAPIIAPRSSSGAGTAMRKSCCKLESLPACLT